MTDLLKNLGNGPHHTWIKRHLDYPHADCCLIWPFRTQRAGCAAFNLRGRMLSVHRFICELKHGLAPAGYVAAHSCSRGHEGCVNPHHLSWKTNGANQLDRKDGQGNRKRSKLTKAIAAEIRAMVGQEPVSITARRFGVSLSAVRQVQSGKTWREDLRKRAGDLTAAQAAAIMELKGKKRQGEIAKQFGVSHTVVWRIHKGLTYQHAIKQCSQTIGIRS